MALPRFAWSRLMALLSVLLATCAMLLLDPPLLQTMR
jgi:hypothetical protein